MYLRATSQEEPTFEIKTMSFLWSIIREIRLNNIFLITKNSSNMEGFDALSLFLLNEDVLFQALKKVFQ